MVVEAQAPAELRLIEYGIQPNTEISLYIYVFKVIPLSNSRDLPWLPVGYLQFAPAQHDPHRVKFSYLSCHQIRIRKYVNFIFISLHVEFGT